MRKELIIIGLMLFLVACSKTPEHVLDRNLKNHENLAVHIHPTLEIYVLGEKQEIPADLGITDDVMRVIHTHDTTGKLHVESPVPHQFYLKDVFIIWGKTFNSSCVLEYCVDEKHILKIFVNEREDARREAIPLRDGDVIRIEYSKE